VRFKSRKNGNGKRKARDGTGALDVLTEISNRNLGRGGVFIVERDYRTPSPGETGRGGW